MAMIDTSRIIIHLDYDCFYASVIEHDNPDLKGKPLAVQQKQIVVTCNYEARKRGIRKLQLLKDAKKICPDLTIVLGEDLTPFRNASKTLYNFLRSFSWNSKIERLGLDEVFLDVTDIVQYNVQRVNLERQRTTGTAITSPRTITTTSTGTSTTSTVTTTATSNDHHHQTFKSFFHLSKIDTTNGFYYDSTVLVGNYFPQASTCNTNDHHHLDKQLQDTSRTRNTGLHLELDSQNADLKLRLYVASHLGQHIRSRIETEIGYTCSIGISTSKLLSKVIGNLNKPRSQTTLLPPYDYTVNLHFDTLEIGRLPGIGFKTTKKLCEFVAKYIDLENESTTYVHQLKAIPNISPVAIERYLTGPRVSYGIGQAIWNIIHGADNSPVAIAQDVPKQISIEDTYGKIDTLEILTNELIKLSSKLILRMHIDLLDQNKWVGRPRNVRLSARPAFQHQYQHQHQHQQQNHIQINEQVSLPNYSRTSRSVPAPPFVFNIVDPIGDIASRLTHEHLIPLFRKMYNTNDKNWAIGLLNVAVINIDDVSKNGKDIEVMLRTNREIKQTMETRQIREVQEIPHNLSLTNNHNLDVDPNYSESHLQISSLSQILPQSHQSQSSQISEGWHEEESVSTFENVVLCRICGIRMPSFAKEAHERYHSE